MISTLEQETQTADLVKTIFAENPDDPVVNYEYLFEELDRQTAELGSIKVVSIEDQELTYQNEVGGRTHIKGMRRCIVYHLLQQEEPRY